MYTARIHVTGIAPRTFTNSKGNQNSITNVFVYTETAPFPVEIGIFEEISLPRGDYDVPFRFDVYQGRLNVRFDFKQATPVKA